jgi:uncharacterized membrane protein
MFARMAWVLCGGLIVMMGNAIQKLPRLSAHIPFLRLDPWQWTRHARFVGKVTVGMGHV